jgi:phosphate transport system substrate-binding protein
MKKLSLIALILIFLFSCAEKEKGKVKDTGQEYKQSGQITISSDPQLERVLDIFIEKFTVLHENIEIVKVTNQPQLYLHAKHVESDFNLEESWKVTVMREGMLPVMSKENPFKETILEKGFSKQMLANVFTDQLQWGEFPGITSDKAITTFLPPEGRGLNARWARYLGVPRDELNGIHVTGREEFISRMENDPYSIGLMNACCIYNPETNQPIPALMALPIDYNDNGKIDSKEKFYEDLCRLERAVYLGVLPAELCCEVYLVSKNKPSAEPQIEFIRWLLTDAQKLVEENGYARLRNYNIEKVMEELNAI